MLLLGIFWLEQNVHIFNAKVLPPYSIFLKIDYKLLLLLNVALEVKRKNKKIISQQFDATYSS